MESAELENLIREKLKTINYKLISMKFSLTKDGNVLALVVDRKEDIDMDAIVEVTNVVSSYLDELDPFPAAYSLDISSLGAEKPLAVEELPDYVGKYVHVHLVNPVQGENILEGTLKDAEGENITLSYRIKTRTVNAVISKKNISHIRLAIQF